MSSEKSFYKNIFNLLLYCSSFEILMGYFWIFTKFWSIDAGKCWKESRAEQLFCHPNQLVRSNKSDVNSKMITISGLIEGPPDTSPVIGNNVRTLTHYNPQSRAPSASWGCHSTWVFIGLCLHQSNRRDSKLTPGHFLPHCHHPNLSVEDYDYETGFNIHCAS